MSTDGGVADAVAVLPAIQSPVHEASRAAEPTLSPFRNRQQHQPSLPATSPAPLHRPLYRISSESELARTGNGETVQRPMTTSQIMSPDSRALEKILHRLSMEDRTMAKKILESSLRKQKTLEASVFDQTLRASKLETEKARLERQLMASKQQSMVIEDQEHRLNELKEVFEEDKQESQERLRLERRVGETHWRRAKILDNLLGTIRRATATGRSLEEVVSSKTDGLGTKQDLAGYVVAVSKENEKLGTKIDGLEHELKDARKALRKALTEVRNQRRKLTRLELEQKIRQQNKPGPVELHSQHGSADAGNSGDSMGGSSVGPAVGEESDSPVGVPQAFLDGSMIQMRPSSKQAARGRGAAVSDKASLASLQHSRFRGVDEIARLAAVELQNLVASAEVDPVDVSSMLSKLAIVLSSMAEAAATARGDEGLRAVTEHLVSSRTCALVDAEHAIFFHPTLVEKPGQANRGSSDGEAYSSEIRSMWSINTKQPTRRELIPAAYLQSGSSIAAEVALSGKPKRALDVRRHHMVCEQVDLAMFSRHADRNIPILAVPIIFNSSTPSALGESPLVGVLHLVGRRNMDTSDEFTDMDGIATRFLSATAAGCLAHSSITSMHSSRADTLNRILRAKEEFEVAAAPTPFQPHVVLDVVQGRFELAALTGLRAKASRLFLVSPDRRTLTWGLPPTYNEQKSVQAMSTSAAAAVLRSGHPMLLHSDSDVTNYDVDLRGDILICVPLYGSDRSIAAVLEVVPSATRVAREEETGVAVASCNEDRVYGNRQSSPWGEDEKAMTMLEETIMLTQALGTSLDQFVRLAASSAPTSGESNSATPETVATQSPSAPAGASPPGAEDTAALALELAHLREANQTLRKDLNEARGAIQAMQSTNGNAKGSSGTEAPEMPMESLLFERLARLDSERTLILGDLQRLRERSMA